MKPMKKIKIATPLLITLCLGLATSGASFGLLQQPTSPIKQGVPMKQEAAQAPEKSEELYREGTQLKQVRGRFQADFDRVEFVSEKGDSTWLVLENLTLQRVEDELTDEVELGWQVDGMVTEYNGRNYLLLERAYVYTSEDR